MKRRLFELCKKYKLSIIVGAIVTVIGLIGIVLYSTLGNDKLIKEFKNENYIVKYDNSWKINSKKDKLFVLEHDKGSKLSIEIITLQEEYKFSNVDAIIDKLIYDIELQNKDFKLLYKERDTITKNKYEGYRLLYENKDSQAMVVVAKKGDKIIIFIYEAKNKYFDILLDSVQNIIYEFDTVEEKFDLTHNLNIETETIKYGESEKVISLLNKTAEYEVASNNYHVKYSVPDNFKLTNINSQYNYLKFEDLEDESISMTVSVFNRNIYEYLSKEYILGVYSEYKTYKDDKDYSRYTESIDKFESDFESYIYKCSFYYDKALQFNENFETSYKSELQDHIILVYALDRNHILKIVIESNDTAIPKELVDMIKINSSENYSSFSNSIKENKMLKSNLKRYTGYEKNLQEIIINLPDTYKEIDKDLNIYENRNYGLNFNEDLEIYEYELKYTLSGIYSKIDNEINLVNSSFIKSYGDYKELTYSGEKIINGKKFIVYDGGYTNMSGIMFTSINRVKYYVNVKVLFYELSEGGYLSIKLESNGKEISDKLINEITNFDIKN